MKKLVLYFTATLMVAFLSSCSDDTTTSPNTEQGTGMPLAVGNKWEYQTFNTDANGNTTGAAISNYSHLIVGTRTIAGKDAYILTDNSDESIDTTYIYTDESGIYGYKEPEEIGELSIWLKTIDFKNTKWDIYEVNIDVEDEEEGTSTKGVSGMKGERIASSKLTYKGRSYDVQNYLNIMYSDLVNTYIDENDELVTETQSESDTTQISFIPGLGVYSTTNQEYIFKDGELSEVVTKDVLVNHNLK